MIRTEYTILATDGSIDARAAADACNKSLMATGNTYDRELAAQQIRECHPALRDALKIATEQVIDVYVVDADRVTGEWLGKPEFDRTEALQSWNARVDTDEIHFDTFEHGDPPDADTRAIECHWVK